MGGLKMVEEATEARTLRGCLKKARHEAKLLRLEGNVAGAEALESFAKQLMAGHSKRRRGSPLVIGATGKKKQKTDLIKMSPEDQEAFVKAILDPPPLAPAMKRAMKRNMVLFEGMDPEEEEIWEPNDFRCERHGVYGSELPWPQSCTFCGYENRIAELEAVIKSIKPDWDGNPSESPAPDNPIPGNTVGGRKIEEDTANTLTPDEVEVALTGGLDPLSILQQESDPVVFGKAAYTAMLHAGLTVAESALRLNIPKYQVREGLKAKTLIAIGEGRGRRLPAFQFTEGGVLPGWATVAQKLVGQYSIVAVEQWLLRLNPDLVIGEDEISVCPRAWLLDGRDPQVVAELIGELQ